MHAVYLALARFNLRASSLTGNVVFGAFLIASTCLPPAFSSSYSCAIEASIRSLSRSFGQIRPPFRPLSRSGFNTPESTMTPVVFRPPSRSCESNRRHRPSPPLVRLPVHVLRHTEFAHSPLKVSLTYIFPLPSDLLRMQSRIGRSSAPRGWWKADHRWPVLSVGIIFG